jgi:hypothetical protein
MKIARSTSFWLLYVIALGILLAAFWVTSRAMATETIKPTQTQTQSQSQTTNANPSSTANAGHTSYAIGLGSTAPTTPDCPGGLVPGARGKRGLSVFKLVELSAVCRPPDDAQEAAISAFRAHELELARIALEPDRLRAEAERDRAAVERINAEGCRQECLAK